jgi:hypothetical protein
MPEQPLFSRTVKAALPARPDRLAWLSKSGYRRPARLRPARLRLARLRLARLRLARPWLG